MQYPATQSIHGIPPDRLRAAVLGRRIRVSPEVEALLAELCFGAARDHASALPVSTGRVR